jgi:hypothetical protein
VSTGLEWEYEDVFAGRPEALEYRARTLQAKAEAISRAADALKDLVDDQKGEAVDALKSAADEAAAGLRRARKRYGGTASALTTYAVELGPIQATARTAISDADAAQERSYRLQGEADDLRNEITLAEAKGEPTDALYKDLWSASDGAAAATGQIDAARRILNQARQDIWDAANRAIDQIETAIEHGADSFGDNWNQFWDSVGDFFEMVGEWAAGVLSVVWEALQQLMSALVSALVVALLVVIGLLVVGLIFTLFGVVGLIVAGAALAVALLTMAIAETLAKPQQVSADRRRTVDDLEARDYQGIMDDLAEQDKQGGEDLTQIRVVAIRDADGNVISWRIQLPSTQNWNPLNSGGALNDARTDVMLSMFPGVPTQYEQAVWDAMTEAGVFESDAPIMFTGWSLGGMMAGELATDPRVADRVESVFTAGSAIDKHYSAMPPDVRVTQINNGIDPVHTLEFVGLEPIDYVRFDNDWQTYRPLTWPMHDAVMYGAEAERYLPEPRPGDEIFFAEEGAGSYEDVYVAEYKRGS